MEQLPVIQALTTKYNTSSRFDTRRQGNKILCSNEAGNPRVPTTVYDPNNGEMQLLRYEDIQYQTSIFKPLMDTITVEDQMIIVEAVHRHWATIYATRKCLTTDKEILAYMRKFYYTDIEDPYFAANIVFLYGAWLYLIEHGEAFAHAHVMWVLDKLEHANLRSAYILEDAIRVITHHWRQTYNASIQGQIVTVYNVSDVSDDYDTQLHLETVCTTLEDN